MKEKSKKTRITSLTQLMGNILVIFLGLFLFILFLIMFFGLKDFNLESRKEIIIGAFFVLALSISMFYLSRRIRTIYIDNDFIYIGTIFFNTRVELFDVKEIKRKQTLSSGFLKSKIFILEYVDKNMIGRKIEILPSTINLGKFNSLKKSINNKRVNNLS